VRRPHAPRRPDKLDIMTRILLIRFSSIGDIVLTSPVVRCLKLQLPGAEIHYLTKKKFLPLVNANPYIDKTWGFDDNFGELLPKLKKQQFTFVADLHRNLRSAWVVMNLMKPAGTYPKLNLQKWLLARLKIDLLPDIHIVDRYFRAVGKLEVKNDGNGLDHFIPPDEEVSNDLLPVSHRDGFYAFAIGARHNTKIFPADRVATLCAKLPKPIVLLGGPEDMERAERIALLAGGRVYNTCGQLTINQSASLVRQAEKVITNDTGLMHIAAALKKPVISIWGNTVPAFGMYPYLPKGMENLSSIVEVKGLHCRPCSKLGYDACPKKHFDCMNRIEDDQILSSL
jgi:ADP-heptose:LPS heptosyltransferase